MTSTILEMTMGAALALLNFLAKIFIHQRYGKQQAARNVIKILKWNVVRLGCLVGLLSYMVIGMKAQSLTFILSFLLSCILFMFMETLYLHRSIKTL